MHIPPTNLSNNIYFIKYLNYILGPVLKFCIYINLILVCVCAQSLQSVWLFAMLWTAARQAPVYRSLQARILEWVAMPSSKGSSQPSDQTCISCISCIAGGFFTAQPPGKPQCNPETVLKCRCYYDDHFIHEKTDVQPPATIMQPVGDGLRLKTQCSSQSQLSIPTSEPFS